MNVQRGKMVGGGRLQVPADIRRALHLSDGDEVVMRVVDGELRVVPAHDRLQRVQALLGHYLADDGRSWTDELIAARRAEAARE